MAEKIYVTQTGLEELKAEHENLIHVVRKEVIEELKNARAQGDLSENADYDAARDHQAQVEARINTIDEMLKNIEIIGLVSSDTVKIGTTITILEVKSNVESTYTIVGSVEADPLNGKLSNVTPLALSILDKKVGDTGIVDVAEPYEVKIVDIKSK